jgi:GxxExxY protein
MYVAFLSREFSLGRPVRTKTASLREAMTIFLRLSQPNKTSVSVCVGLWQIIKMVINDITYRINGAIFEVNRELGAGFLEKVYQNALMVELAGRKLKAESQVPITVRYKNVEVGEYFADIVVENQIILELKVVDSLQKIHEAQILNYLKATSFKIGLLVNFTHPKAEIKRFIL